MSIPVQVATHFIVTNIGPIISSVITSAYSYNKPVQQPTIIHEIDDERELDLLQMNRFVKWMKLIFDGETKETHREYKQELYNIYVTICSDHKQYQQWKKYNESLWSFSLYSKKNTKTLAKKILGDITLFKEGLKMFSMFEKL
jgi:hypothetical protein